MEEALIRFVRTELLGPDAPAFGVDDEIFIDGTIDFLGISLLLEFIEREFHVAISTGDVTADTFASIASVVALVEGMQATPSGLTNAQRLLWTSQALHPEAPLYNTAYLFTIDGAVDVPAFRAAFDQLIRDADVLRTVTTDDDGVPRQAVLTFVSFTLPVIDLSSSEEPDAVARTWARDRCRTPLDVARSTFDAALLELSDRRFAFYFNQHHIVADALGLRVLYERLEARYREQIRGVAEDLDPLPSFADYVEFEAAHRAAEARASSSAQRPDDSGLVLYGRRSSAATTANRRVSVELDDVRSEALRRAATQPGVRAITPELSVFQLLATGLAAYLHRVSGQTRIVLGVPVHNRSTAAFRQMPGLFMEVYPLAIEVADDDSFATLHRTIASATTDLIRSARPGSASAADNREIHALLNYLTVTFPSFAGLPVTAEWIHTDAVDPHHAVRLHVHDYAATGRPTLSFDLNVEVFDEGARERVPHHFLAVVDGMLDGWDSRIASVPLVGGEERLEVARAINTRPRAADAEAPDDVVTAFLRWAEREPDAPAVTDGGVTLTYSDLDRRSAAVAGSLDAGLLVGIALGRSVEALITMLGVLRAGAAYVPIDPQWPAERIAFVAEDAGIDVLVVDRDAVPIAARVTSFESLVAGRPRPRGPVSGADLAYILYTSGSTGTPKGVMIDHRALANYVGWASDFYDAGRRLTFPLFTALTFDLTVTSVFVPLVSGGTIRVYPEAAGEADLTVLSVLDDDAVDIIKLTPSHLALATGAAARPTRLRQLILGGEDLTTAVAARAAAMIDGPVAIHNEYGPTEATVGCVVHTYDPHTDVEGSVPIGRPIRGARIHVVDGAGHPVPFGVPGELVIAGVGLARGYTGRPDLTADRFVDGRSVGEGRVYRTGDIARARPSGTIEYLGRRDDQVKIKGMRVELGEIESAVAAHPGITAAAVRLFEPESLDPSDVIHCARCGLASTYPGVSFDRDRVCNECRAFDGYRERADVYFKPERELASILTGQRGRRGEYDCISLLSGGKDSTYVLSRLVDMGVRPLAFTLDNGYLSDQALGNIDRVVDALGVDHRYATTPAMNEIFVDSLQRHANVCDGCFKTIYTLAIRTALDEDIPYIVTGLSRGQFFETRLTPELFTELTVGSDQIDAAVLEARKAYHRVDDAVNRLLDVSMFEDDDVFERVQFVDFYRYVDVDLDDLYAYLDTRVPWKRPSDTGRSTNCLINDVGIYYHTKVRGYHNYALPYSWDVRMGHKTRDTALEELDDDIDVAEVARILDEIGFPDDVTGVDAGRTLVSYYAAPVEIPVPELKRHLSSTLPAPLVPSRFVRLDAIPLTENGKIDRDRLPSPDHSRPELATAYVAPSSETEVVLARIWEQVLGVEGIGVRDNYFDLGGDSIAAVQIIARAQREGIPLTMHQIMDALTIERLAAATGPADPDQLAATPGSRPAYDLAGLDEGGLDTLASLLRAGEKGPPR